MDIPPASWEDIVNAPEIPKKFNGEIVECQYFHLKIKPQISFVPVLLKTKLEGKECKWYISNSTASCLQSNGYRKTCLMPMEAKKEPDFLCYFYDYETTKQYATWFFNKKGKLIIKDGTATQLHFLLCFFCEDDNWAPFHYDLMYDHPSIVELVKPQAFCETDITQKLLNRKQFETNGEFYSKEEIAFMRALVALTSAYSAEFRNENSFKNFVKNQIVEFNKVTNYDVSYHSFLYKTEFNEFYQLSLLRVPILFAFIHRYFLSLNNVEGEFVRNATKKFQTLSFFNLIYRFLTTDDTRLVHIDRTVLRELWRFKYTLLELENDYREKLPYVELISHKLEPRVKTHFKTLAGIAYLYAIENLPKCESLNYEKMCNQLKHVPNLQSEITVPLKLNNCGEYIDFHKMVNGGHKYMKNIPWDKYPLEPIYANYLSELYLNDYC